MNGNNLLMKNNKQCNTGSFNTNNCFFITERRQREIKLQRERERERVATVSMETNIALGLFVNSTQLLFRVIGAPPCHNNSLKEEQFNVNNIFSICLFMKSCRSTGEKLPLAQAGRCRLQISLRARRITSTPAKHQCCIHWQ